MKALSIKNLKKTYKDTFHALKGIDLEVEEGDFFALLGPNGAGKSTTIGIVTSLINKTSGTVKVFGTDIDEDFDKAKTYIGVVPQEFNFSIFETVLQIVVTQAGYYGIPRDIAMARAEYYLKKLDLWEKKDSQARTLSGGMKRRLMIARALIHEPKLLILDEPTAGVDVELRVTMWEFIKEINKKGITIILTTHYLEEAEELCKNVAIINNGQIVENTSVKKLLKKVEGQSLILDIDRDLVKAPNLGNFDCQIIDSNTIQVNLGKDEKINEVFAELSKHKIGVLSMKNKRNRLEELFLELTAKKEVKENE